MMRRTRAFLPLCVLLLPLAAACSGENIPPATGPAQQTPTPAPTPAPASPDPTPVATATPMATPPPTASPTPSPVSTTTPTTVPTHSPTPVTTATPTASPSLTPAPTQPATDYIALTMGEPRGLPEGTALYFRQYHSCHGPQDWLRAITTDTGELAWDDPLGELPRRSDDDYWDAASLEGVSASGQTLAAWVCERGYCGSIERERSEDAVESLWVSGDGGESWERWGDYPRGRVSIVTEEDVAFMSNWSWSDDYQARAWWVRSGEELVPPEGLADPTLLGWRLDREAPEPIWADSELTVLVSPSGERLGDSGLVQERDFEAGRWLASHHYGPTLWRAVLDAYSFDEPLAVFDHVEGQFFVGLLGGYACGDSGLTVLVDFTSGTVHPIPGLDAREGFVPFAARPAPD